jgi:transcriptional regulator with XRE-family HTH domain
VNDDLDTLLGIDPADPLQALARQLVANDDKLMDDLAAHRLAAGITLATVAKRMNVRVGTVRELEREGSDPALSTLRRYALAIGAVIEHTVTAAPSPTAEQQAPVRLCLCDHTAVEHIGSEGPCKDPDCQCTVYRPRKHRGPAAPTTRD